MNLQKTWTLFGIGTAAVLAASAGTALGQRVLVVPDDLTMTQALSVAEPGDTIEIRGSIGVEQTFVINTNNLTIRGAGGVISTNGFTRAFTASNAQNLRIEDLTITGGSNLFEDEVVDAAGLFVSGGSVTLERVNFTNLRATRDAGALFVTDATAAMIDCVFEGNQSDDDGGAVVLQRSQATISGGTFTNNRTTGDNASQPLRLGGAIAIVDDSNVLIDGTAFEGNRGFDPGGAVAASRSERLEILNATFIDNGGTGDGGAVWMGTGGQLIVRDTLFEDNFVTTTFREGGALGADNNVTVDISGCTFLRNRAEDSNGGAVHLINGVVGVLSDNEFRYNWAEGNGGAAVMASERPVLQQRNAYLGNRGGGIGGGVWILGETPPNAGEANIYDSVFVGNTAADGAAIATQSGPDNAVVNCTIVMNTSLEEDGGAYTIAGTNTLAFFTNVIVQGNTAAVGFPGGGPTLFRQSNVQGLAGRPFDVPENVNIDADPMFVAMPDDGGDGFGDDPSTPEVDESLNDFFGDLRLTSGSPSIDAGDTAERLRPDPLPPLGGALGTRANFNPTSIFDPTDLAGGPRVVTVDGFDPSVDLGVPILNNVIDHGAYEFQGEVAVAIPGCNPADIALTQGEFGTLDGNDIAAFVQLFLSGCP